MQQEEQWKPVIVTKNGVVYDYSELYEVCNKEGKVRNKKTGKLLKPIKNKSGYLQVGFKGEKFYVQRLVATAFIPNPNNYPEVNHKDENKENNSADNLEWCTRQQNVNHGTCIQRRREALTLKGKTSGFQGKQHSEEAKHKISEAKKGHEPTNTRKVRCIETGEIFDTVKEAKEWCGITGGICSCCKGKLKTCGGYSWEYVQEDED